MSPFSERRQLRFLPQYVLCGSFIMKFRGHQVFPFQARCRTSGFTHRFVRGAHVFGTQTGSGNEPFQHPPLSFRHFYFFLLSIETTVAVVALVFPSTRAVEEFVSVAASVRVECEYIAELSWEDKRQN